VRWPSAIALRFNPVQDAIPIARSVPIPAASSPAITTTQPRTADPGRLDHQYRSDQ